MLVLARGEATPHEVPDPSAAATVVRGDAPASVTSGTVHDVSAIVPQMFVPAPDSAGAQLIFSSALASTQSSSSAPTLFVPVMNVASDLLTSTTTPHPDAALNHSSFAELQARGGEGAVVLTEPLSFASYADNGWFIVPSAANEYGEGFASGDGFAFNVATGEFTADWFFFA